MRSSDFSKAPIKAQGESMFVGATHYKGPWAWIILIFTFFRMERMLKKHPGYCWHKTYYDFPFTLGTIAAFRDQDSMLRFARSKHHRNLMQWATKNKRNADGGYIRLFDAAPNGYTNGVWRAEDDEWAHIERFTPTTKEAAAGTEPPFVKQALAREEAERTAAAIKADHAPGTVMHDLPHIIEPLHGSPADTPRESADAPRESADTPRETTDTVEGTAVDE